MDESQFIGKKEYAAGLGIPLRTISSWQQRHWKRGYHYTVIGRTTLIHKERAETWILKKYLQESSKTESTSE